MAFAFVVINYLLDDHFHAFLLKDDVKNLRLLRSFHTVNPIQFNVFNKRMFKSDGKRK